MANTFYFYDVETSGFDPRQARVMQFAGQRTDLNLKPIGKPLNSLIKLTSDVIPDPDAVLVTGITPQATLADGLTEAEFLKLFYEQAVQPNTIFVGFNSLRFDDEFMRFMNYRNFYDAYGWHWEKGCSRWDLLDVVRMTRALRPAGLKWPFAPDGKPTNRLEFLASINKLEHDQAHDALSDVKATIAVAKLIKTKQPDLFEYLLMLRDKAAVSKLVETGQPFVYTSGRYSSSYFHTTAAALLASHPQENSALVYDLRYDPTAFVDLSVEEIIQRWRYNPDPAAQRLPVKTMKYNRCPAVAPLGVIKDPATQERLQLNLSDIQANLSLLKNHSKVFIPKVLAAIDRLDSERQLAQADLMDNPLTVDSRLYENFISNQDKQSLLAVRRAPPEQLNVFIDKFKDTRLKNLLPLYKARNFPISLSSEERQAWEKFCQQQLIDGESSSRLAKYFARLQELSTRPLTHNQQFLLEELQLYGQSLMPADAIG